MERFEMDVVNACKMIDGDDVDESYYNKIYMSSNESLKNLFLNFDISLKDVLTVLGSSDQLFYSYLNGAKRVDCFDINVLARHYYYLRKWSIDYLGMYYPPDSFLKSHLWIYNLLSLVTCGSEEEEESFSFWKLFIARSLGCDNKSLFFVGKGDYNTVSDLHNLKCALKTYPFRFYHQDLSMPLSFDDKYDVIIISNILEYLSKPEQIQQCCFNLRKLLKEDGLVVCSYVMNKPNSFHSQSEKELFCDSFDFIPYDSYYTSEYGFQFPTGYAYKKKKSVHKK